MISTKKNKLYVLEKIWHYKPNFKFSQDELYEVLIRPCNVSYRTYRNFSLGHNIKNKTITHEGCVLSWWPDNSHVYIYSKEPRFKSLEEFMIYANVDKCIIPLIENWMIMDNNHRNYFAKTIDLKTNEILYDNSDLLLTKLNEQYNRNLI